MGEAIVGSRRCSPRSRRTSPTRSPRARRLGRDRLLADGPGPSSIPALVVDDVTFAVQVNGKLRGEIRVAAVGREADVRAVAEAEEQVMADLAGKTLRKFVFVPKRLVNFVVG